MTRDTSSAVMAGKEANPKSTCFASSSVGAMLKSSLLDCQQFALGSELPDCTSGCRLPTSGAADLRQSIAVGLGQHSPALELGHRIRQNRFNVLMHDCALGGWYLEQVGVLPSHVFLLHSHQQGRSLAV